MVPLCGMVLHVRSLFHSNFMVNLLTTMDFFFISMVEKKKKIKRKYFIVRWMEWRSEVEAIDLCSGHESNAKFLIEGGNIQLNKTHKKNEKKFTSLICRERTVECFVMCAFIKSILVLVLVSISCHYFSLFIDHIIYPYTLSSCHIFTK